MNKAQSISLVALALILSFAFYVRYLSANNGLPYLYEWDEPFISTSAVNIIKTGDINPANNPEICYGGFLRYTCAGADWIYYKYLVLSGQIADSSEIKTSMEGGFRTLSHPEFYFINRILVALLSILGVYFVFAIARALTSNAWTGVMGALFMVSFMNYFEGSIYALVNVPMTVMTLGALFFALSYLQHKNRSSLIWSFVFAGLAASTKLTGGLSPLFPVLSYLMVSRPTNIQEMKATMRALFLYGLVVLAVFLALNPNLLTDTQNYLYWNEWIIQVYKEGKGHLSREPGWEHFTYQVALMKQEAGVAMLGLGIAGFVLFFLDLGRERVGFTISRKQVELNCFLAAFPVIYLVYVTTTYRVAYARNFIVLYPFLAIYAAIGVTGLARLMISFFPKVTAPAIQWMQGLAVVVPLVIVMDDLSYMFRYARVISERKDTRTVAIDELNKIQSRKIIGVPRELQFSEVDLRRLKHPYRMYSAYNIRKAFVENSIVLSGLYKSQDQSLHRLDSELNQMALNSSLLHRIDGGPIYLDTTWMAMQAPTTNPEVILLRGTTYEAAAAVPLDVLWTSSIAFFEDGRKLIGRPFLEEATYQMILNISGTPARGVYPHINIYLDGIRIKEFSCEHGNTIFPIEVNIRQRGLHRIEMEFDNDMWTASEDRNVFLSSARIFLKR